VRYLALATDYDGTIATDGHVGDDVVWALSSLRATGRKLILVTGRELEPLLDVFPHIDLFDRVVVENGALLYRPDTHEEKRLGEAPPEEFVDALWARGVNPVSVGRGIVSTWHPHETAVLDAIRELGLELHVIFNKGAVMVLPSGVNKATGLQCALRELGLSPHNVVGVGDAENDHAFLSLCECGVAVANALPMLKDRADHTTRADHGAGVVELIEAMSRDDLAGLEPALARHHVPIGTAGEDPVTIPPYGTSVLLSGPSGAGKSTLSTALLEALGERGYQYCVVDPEGDYEVFEGAIVLGDKDRPPSADEVLQVLDCPDDSVVVNLIGLRLEDRPPFFEALLPQLLELRVFTGRPNFLVVDEAHHLLPAAWEHVASMLPKGLASVLYITVHPDWVARPVLESIDVVLTVGASPEETFGRFASAAGCPPPSVPAGELGPGEALRWATHDPADVVRFRISPSRQERRRHVRKYAQGDMGEYSFHFRGPEGKLNLKAQNLTMFVQLADGVDDDTWQFHLCQGDYSRWLRDNVKDLDLADAAAAVEQHADELSPAQSRAQVREAIEKDYTLPA
jgi:HAD superfamily hydrolase (TIGR01484 family)